MASEKLFGHVLPSVWEKPTFVIFYHCLDNYEKRTGIADTITATEVKETRDFLAAAMQTRPMQYCRAYLAAKARSSAVGAAAFIGVDVPRRPRH